MIDLSTILAIQQGTQQLAQQVAQAQQQASASQAPPSTGADPTNPASASTALASQLFAQLGALLNNAANQPAQVETDPDLAALQRQAAMLNAKVTSLIAKADALESELNLSPTPDLKSIDELMAQFLEIMKELDDEMSKLQKQIEARKKENEMNCEQKPTALKAGEDPNAPSFNTTFSTV